MSQPEALSAKCAYPCLSNSTLPFCLLHDLASSLAPTGVISCPHVFISCPDHLPFPFPVFPTPTPIPYSPPPCSPSPLPCSPSPPPCSPSPPPCSPSPCSPLPSPWTPSPIIDTWIIINLITSWVEYNCLELAEDTLYFQFVYLHNFIQILLYFISQVNKRGDGSTMMAK